MLTPLVAALVTGLLITAQQSDTTIAVAAGARLDVEADGGEIAVTTWNRNEVRVQAVHGGRDEIRVTASRSVVRVRAESSRPGPGIIEYRITVPVGMDLDLEGLYTDISVEGTQGQVRAETVQGAIRIVGGTGRIALSTVQGGITVEGARGSVRAESVVGEIRLRAVQGSIDAETVSGSVVLEGIEASEVSASAVSGRIFFDGSIADGGSYSFATHSGAVTVALQPNLNATVTVALLSGSLDSTVPALTSTGARGRRQTYTAGDGNAMLEVESFSGNVRIALRGEVAPPGPR